MAGGDVGTAKLHSQPGILYGVAGGADVRKERLLLIGKCTEDGERQMDLTAAKTDGCPMEAVEDAGGALCPAGRKDFPGKKGIVCFGQILFPENDSGGMSRRDLFNSCGKICPAQFPVCYA